MECFFYQGEPIEAASYWFDEIPAIWSDFVPYFERELGVNNAVRSRHKNVKIRMVEMVRKMSEARAVQNDRSTRHMLKERLRRRSHKEGFAALHALLPSGTECDKISVIREAALEIVRMRRVLEDLRRRNRELEMKLADQGSDRVDEGECSGSSGNVKMVESLHCNKRLRAQFL